MPVNETARSVPPAGTLLVYAALGGFWAIGASALTIVVFVLVSSGSASGLFLALGSVVVGPLFGVPLGMATGAGALAGLAVRRSPWFAAAGGGLVAALVSTVALIWMHASMQWAWIPPALLVAVVALTPLSLRLAARRPQAPDEPRSTWLMVGGLVVGTTALLLGPVFNQIGLQVLENDRPENFGAFSSQSALVPYPAAALALVGAIALITGLWLTRRRAGGQGFFVSFLAIMSSIGLVAFAVIQLAAISSDAL